MVENDGDYAARSSPGEIIQFRCPCCGQHAPVTRLTEDGPFEFEIFRKVLGGKRKLTDQERIDRRGHRHGLGNAPGKIDYEPIRMMKKYQDAMAKRLRELGGSGGPSISEVNPPTPTTPEFDIEALKSNLNSLMNEDKKAQSIKALEKALAGIDEDKVDITDLEDAIQEYKDITREGLTPEEYTDEKQSGFENIQEQIDSLEAIEGDDE